MSCLIAVVADDLASTAARNTTTPASEATSTTPVTISIIALCIRVNPISVVGTLPHEFEAATLIFIVAYGFTELTVRIL